MKNGKVIAKLMQNAKVERIEIVGKNAVVVLKDEFRSAGRRTHTLPSAHAVRLFIQAASTEKTVTNLMSGKPITIPANTPLCCDPSSETYWSM